MSRKKGGLDWSEDWISLSEAAAVFDVSVLNLAVVLSERKVTARVRMTSGKGALPVYKVKDLEKALAEDSIRRLGGELEEAEK